MKGFVTAISEDKDWCLVEFEHDATGKAFIRMMKMQGEPGVEAFPFEVGQEVYLVDSPGHPTKEVEFWMMKYASQRARNAVFMQFMAQLAREGRDVRDVLKRADDASVNVSLEDFTTAQVNDD